MSSSSSRETGTVRVLAAVIRRGDSWLVCRRPDHKRHGGLWEFPGGKLEPGEDLLAAAHRELDEELGVRVVAIGEPLLEVRDAGSPFIIVFTPVNVDGEPQALEHPEVRWVTAGEALRLPLAPADRTFAEQVLRTDS